MNSYCFSPLTPPPPIQSTITSHSKSPKSQSENLDQSSPNDDNISRLKDRTKPQKLLTLLRSIQKESLSTLHDIKDNPSLIKDEALNLLLEFQSNLSRSDGLFGGQKYLAEQFLSSLSSMSPNDGGGAFHINSTNNKQKKQKRGGSSRGLIDIDAVRRSVFWMDTATEFKTNNSCNPTVCVENLWLACLGRILGVGKNKKIPSSQENKESGQSNKKNNDEKNEFPIPLVFVEVPASCIISICEHTKRTIGNSSLPSQMQFCAKMELEILSVLGVQWLHCLISKIRECLFIMDPLGTYFGIQNPTNDYDNHNNNTTQMKSDNHFVYAHTPNEAIASETASTCLRAAASIITLLGTSLSRSTQTVTQLHSIAWAALGSGPVVAATASDGSYILSNPKLMECASVLASTLPLSGNTGNALVAQKGNNNSHFNYIASPTRLWTEALTNTMNAISVLLHSCYKYKSTSSSPLLDCEKDYGTADTDGWLQNVRTNIISQTKRTAAIQKRFDGLISLLTNLLHMNGYATNINDKELFVKCHLPLSQMLHMCELLIKFGQGIESKYLSMKNQTLRDDVAENNLLLSLSSMVHLTNPIRCAGYSILSSVITMAGSSVTDPLLTHGTYLIELIYFGISTTASMDVQRHFHRISSKRQRQWLNNSVLLRIKVIESVKMLCLKLGSSCATSTVMGKSIVMIVACLLEQINPSQVVIDASDFEMSHQHPHPQWCTLSERVELAIKAVETISAFMVVGGGYIHSTIRATIESSLSSCISTILYTNNKVIQSNSTPLILQSSTFKVAILKVTTNAVITPWQDGGRSTLLSKLRDVSNILRNDRDPDVVMAASTSLALCNMIVTPRSVPLSIVSSREHMEEGRRHGIHSSYLNTKTTTTVPTPTGNHKKTKTSSTHMVETTTTKSDKTLEKMGLFTPSSPSQPMKVEGNETSLPSPNKELESQVKSNSTNNIMDNHNSSVASNNDEVDHNLGIKRKRLNEANNVMDKDNSNRVESNETIDPTMVMGPNNKNQQNALDGTKPADLTSHSSVDSSKEGNHPDESTNDVEENDTENGAEKDKKEVKECIVVESSSSGDSDCESDGSFPEIVDCDPDEQDL